jgi:hypothetical protein
MEKKLLLGVVVVVCLLGSVALALDPMGPPMAGSKKGQWSVGAEYSYSNMELRAINGKIGTTPLVPVDIEDVEINKIYGTIGYGISDRWEAFLRLGLAEGEGEGNYGSVKGEGDCDSALAIGCGTRATFYQASPNLTWGGLAQVSWTRPNGDLNIAGGSYSIDVELIEAQFALGPTYQVTDGVWIYGGPFIHFVDGELSCTSASLPFSYDFEEQVNFGGYIGGQVNFTENFSLNVEWMHNDNADGLGIGLICRLP